MRLLQSLEDLGTNQTDQVYYSVETSLLVYVFVFSVYFEHGCPQCWEIQGLHSRVSEPEVHNSTVCRPKFHNFVGTEIGSGLWN